MPVAVFLFLAALLWFSGFMLVVHLIARGEQRRGETIIAPFHGALDRTMVKRGSL